MTVEILGTEYTINIRKYDDDLAFDRDNCCGYCNTLDHLIVACDMTTYKGWENDSASSKAREQKRILRHEITHAFIAESGLGSDASSSYGAWPMNEEMIDWIARQGPKIYKAWQEADAL